MNYHLDPSLWLNPQKWSLSYQAHRNFLAYPEPQAVQGFGTSIHQGLLPPSKFNPYNMQPNSTTSCVLPTKQEVGNTNILPMEDLPMLQNMSTYPIYFQQSPSFTQGHSYGFYTIPKVENMLQIANYSMRKSVLTKSEINPIGAMFSAPKKNQDMPKLKSCKKCNERKARNSISSNQKHMTSYPEALGQTTQVSKNGGRQYGQDHRQTLESELQHLERKWLSLHQRPQCQVDAAETLVRLKSANSSTRKSTCGTSKKKPTFQAPPSGPINPIVPSMDSKTASSSGVNDPASKRLSLQMSLVYKERLRSITTNVNKTLEEIGKEHNSLKFFFETEIVKLRQRMALQPGQNGCPHSKSRAKAADPNVYMNGKVVVEQVRGPRSKTRRKRKIPKTDIECSSKKKCK